jgi:hypothetical protein
MTRIFFLILFYLFGMVCMAQTPKPYFALIPSVSQSPKTLYREFKNPFWVVNPPCDSIQFKCIKGQAKVWLDKYGSWIIVPDKDSEEVWIGAMCQNNFIDTIKYKTRNFGCNELSLRFKANDTPLEERRRCESGSPFLSNSHEWIPSKFWKEKLKEYQKTHIYQGKLILHEKLIMDFDHKLLDLYSPYDLHFKLDTCTITLYGKYDKKVGKKPIKHQRHYTSYNIEIDLEIIIEKMEKGDILNISIHNALRLNSSGQRSPIPLYSQIDDGWGDDPWGTEEEQSKTILNCLEKNFEIK